MYNYSKINFNVIQQMSHTLYKPLVCEIVKEVIPQVDCMFSCLDGCRYQNADETAVSASPARCEAGVIRQQRIPLGHKAFLECLCQQMKR